MEEILERSFGIPSLDQVRKECFEHLQNLSAADDAEFCKRFLPLLAKLEHQFREEEDLMEEIDYPSRLAHRAHHAQLLCQLHRLVPDVIDGNVALCREMANLMPVWFQYHWWAMDASLLHALTLHKTNNMSFSMTQKPKPAQPQL